MPIVSLHTFRKANLSTNATSWPKTADPSLLALKQDEGINVANAFYTSHLNMRSEMDVAINYQLFEEHVSIETEDLRNNGSSGMVKCGDHPTPPQALLSLQFDIFCFLPSTHLIA